VRRGLAAAVLAASGIALAGCGTSQSAASALRDWVHQSGFHGAAATLRHDAVLVAGTLRDAAAGPNELHTVCEVLDVDAQSANASLPTPDAQATALLGRAYGQLGRAAVSCYQAGDSAARRAASLRVLEGGVGSLAEGVARVAAAS
jgi:hypothetical protein